MKNQHTLTKAVLLVLATAVSMLGCGASEESCADDGRQCEDASNSQRDTTAGEDAETGEEVSTDTTALPDVDPDSCWAWITETNPTCAEGCATMHGDDSFEACEFLPSTFSPVQPVLCHPRDAVVLTVTCLQHDGQTYYITGEPIGMEDLPGWTSCGCE